MLRCLCLVCLLATTSLPALAQRGPTRYYRYQSIGLAAGGTFYSGDLSYSGSLGFPRRQLGSVPTVGPALGLQYQWHFHPHASVRIQAAAGRFEADDRQADDVRRRQRNLHVQTDLLEGSVLLVYEWFGNEREYRWRPKVSPYVMVGLGIVAWNTYSYRDVPNREGRTELRPLRTEGQDAEYATAALVVPMGMGIRFRLSDRWDLRTELGVRATLTDYLDDVSGAGTAAGGYARTYPSPDSRFFGDRRLSTTGDNRRGDPNTNDWYGMATVSLSYILYSDDPCPYPYRRHRKRGLRF